MAQLYQGKWLDTAPAAEEIGEDGRFRRIDSPLRGTISPDPGAECLADRHHVVAIGPELDLTTPHDRARLPGRGVMERAA